MQRERQKLTGGRTRRAKPHSQRASKAEPILIAARRPDSPCVGSISVRRSVAASGRPTQKASPHPVDRVERDKSWLPPPTEKKSARIVQLNGADADDNEKLRLRLLDRLLLSEGRGAVSRAAEEYRRAGFEFPEEQSVQLKLLEHFNEDWAMAALVKLSRLLEDQPPLRRPVLEMRLRRLEEYAEDPATREAAGSLRRAIR
ncbi:hypothetical protein ACFL5O_00890 [Myxococcota bacterium]